MRISTGGGTHHLNLPLKGMFWDLEGMDDHNPQKMDGMGIREYLARSQGGMLGARVPDLCKSIYCAPPKKHNSQIYVSKPYCQAKVK